MVQAQNADVESSFDSSQLPEDKRSKNNNLKASFLDSSQIRKEKAAKFLNYEPNEENIKTNQSGDNMVDENIQDSVIILDVQDLGQPYTSNKSEHGPFEN